MSINFKGYGPTGISYTANSDKEEARLEGQTLRLDMIKAGKTVRTTIQIKSGSLVDLASMGHIAIGYALDKQGNFTNEQMLEVNL